MAGTNIATALYKPQFPKSMVVTEDYEMPADQRVLGVDTTAAAVTITLPAVTDFAGEIICITNLTTGQDDVTVEEKEIAGESYTLDADMPYVLLFSTGFDIINVNPYVHPEEEPPPLG